MDFGTSSNSRLFGGHHDYYIVEPLDEVTVLKSVDVFVSAVS